MSVQTRPLTADELLRMPDEGHRHELIRGDVVPMPLPGGRRGQIAMEIAWRLNSHGKANGLGRIYAAETGLLIERGPDTVRGADAAFVRRGKLGQITQPEKPIPCAPDLAVEVVSPSDRPGEIAGKVAAWLAAGTQVVWVVAPRERSVTAHRAGTAAVTCGEDETLDGGDVLPGFRCPVGELFN